MILLCEHGKWIFYCRHDDKSIPLKAGFSRDDRTQEWFTYNPAIALKLARFADLPVQAELARQAEQARQYLSDSDAETCDWEPPAGKGMKFMDFQRAGIAAICRRLGIGRRNEIQSGRSYPGCTHSNVYRRNIQARDSG